MLIDDLAEEIPQLPFSTPLKLKTVKELVPADRHAVQVIESDPKGKTVVESELEVYYQAIGSEACRSGLKLLHDFILSLGLDSLTSVKVNRVETGFLPRVTGGFRYAGSNYAVGSVTYTVFYEES